MQIQINDFHVPTKIYFISFFLLFQTSTQQTNINLNQFGAIAFNLPSNGSLSDSGISDGGGSSDYGLSERERRLGALRRLAKQLEQALAPGSAALLSIAQRMELAESELKSLQDTCRELIVRTAASQPTNSTGARTQTITDQTDSMALSKMNGTTNQQQNLNFPNTILSAKSKQKRSIQK